MVTVLFSIWDMFMCTPLGKYPIMSNLMGHFVRADDMNIFPSLYKDTATDGQV